MLSYLHRFHAGCFADIHKHLLLTRVFAALARKDKPYCVLDVHGGEGVYDLSREDAMATGELQDGLEAFLALSDAPDLVVPYMDCLRAVAKAEVGDVYPGSPSIARTLMRAQDRLMAVELHPQAHKALRRCFRDDPQVHVHKRDAMEALSALTPPPEKRGVAVIDPAYEVKSEYVSIPSAVAKVYSKWRGGVYFIWYPMLPDRRHEDLIGAIEQTGYPEVYVSEWVRDVENPARGMYGSGVAVINPPWKLDEEMQAIAAWLQASGFAGEHKARMIHAGD